MVGCVCEHVFVCVSVFEMVVSVYMFVKMVVCVCEDILSS